MNLNWKGGGPPFQFKNLEEGSQAPTEWIRSCRRGNQAIGRIWTLELALKACGNASSICVAAFEDGGGFKSLDDVEVGPGLLEKAQVRRVERFQNKVHEARVSK